MFNKISVQVYNKIQIIIKYNVVCEIMKFILSEILIEMH